MTLLCTVGAEQEPGVIELLATGRMVYVTPATTLNIPLSPGRKVLVTLTGTLDANHRALVANVREVAPEENEVNELVQLNAALKQLELPTPSRGDERNWLQKRYESVLTNNAPADDLVLRGLVEAWQQFDLRFPMTDWLEDLGPIVEELAEHLRRHGLPYDIEATSIDTLEALTRLANERSAAVGKVERFFEFDNLPWDDEAPLWLWLTSRQATALVDLKLLKHRVSD